MSSESLAPEVIVWADAERASLVEKVLSLMGSAISVIGIGGPRIAEVDRLGDDSVMREDDLRRLVVERPAAHLLVATREALETADLLAAAKQGTGILALEPIVGDLQDLATLRASGRGRSKAKPLRSVHLPAFSQAPGFLHAAEPTEVLGRRRLVSFDSYGGSAGGSLFARLVDGWFTALAFADMPVLIDASLIGEIEPAPEDLRRIMGRLAAHGRTPDGSGIVLTVSDRAGTSGRWLHVLGDEGELSINDTAYDLRHLDAGRVDSGKTHEEGLSWADLIAHQWRRVLDRPEGNWSPTAEREAEVMACCLATLLSARTGQAENPRKLLEISG